MCQLHLIYLQLSKDPMLGAPQFVGMTAVVAVVEVVELVAHTSSCDVQMFAEMVG